MLKFFLLLLLVLNSSVLAFGLDSPLRISDQPKPELPKVYGTLDAQGTVRLKVEFLANGEIGNIAVITKTPAANLTELAVQSAKKIKFEPETKNGISISRSIAVSYIYGWGFGGWKIPFALSQSQNRQTKPDPQAEAVLQKAIQNLGGEKYIKVSSQIGRGKFSIIKDGVTASFQTFVDVIVYPDKERTEFKGGGVKSIQTNVGDTGWVFDGDQELIKVQTEGQVANFKRGMRVSLDNLLRSHWRNEAKLSYVGRRAATLGKRNDVIKLTYNDGLVVEFEIGVEDGIPVKAIYKRKNSDNEEITEEDRYAQFVDVDGIKSPFIIYRFVNGVQSSRINYQTIEYNKRIPDSIFAKPSNPKEVKKDLKF
ncbi:MAG: TonB family protein [Blastocatellia bacterium]